MWKVKHRRSSIEIIADILRYGEAGKTEIMYGVNMSYSQVNRYLNFLLKQEFLHKAITDDEHAIYRITQKGRNLLQDVETVLEMLQEKELINI